MPYLFSQVVLEDENKHAKHFVWYINAITLTRMSSNSKERTEKKQRKTRNYISKRIGIERRLT